MADELARMRAALADAQAALAGLRAERDAAIQGAERAHRQRHAFLAGLAHDLRNPLAPLSNGIELLRLSDADPAGRLRTRGIMERQVGHLMHIADQLSELARLSGAAPALQQSSFELGAVLAALDDQLGPALQAREMTLERVTEPGTAPRLHGDAQRLAQALGYLVDDIMRHAERGSAIRLEAHAELHTLVLSIATVADADEAAAEPPEEVDVATLGLGVALALQLATLHGGTLAGRRPRAARRARFVMTLPITSAVDAAAPPALELKR